MYESYRTYKLSQCTTTILKQYDFTIMNYVTRPTPILQRISNSMNYFKVKVRINTTIVRATTIKVQLKLEKNKVCEIWE